MTGAEHYAEAERLLTEHAYWEPGLRLAQVHATLALAAAFGAADEPEPEPAPTDDSWITMEKP